MLDSMGWVGGLPWWERCLPNDRLSTTRGWVGGWVGGWMLYARIDMGGLGGWVGGWFMYLDGRDAYPATDLNHELQGSGTDGLCGSVDGWVGGWVGGGGGGGGGGWLGDGKIEEKKVVQMSYCEVGVWWVGGWVGGKVNRSYRHR